MTNENDRWNLTIGVRNALSTHFPDMDTPYQVAKVAVNMVLRIGVLPALDDLLNDLDGRNLLVGTTIIDVDTVHWVRGMLFDLLQGGQERVEQELA